MIIGQLVSIQAHDWFLGVKRFLLISDGETASKYRRRISYFTQEIRDGFASKLFTLMLYGLAKRAEGTISALQNASDTLATSNAHWLPLSQVHVKNVVPVPV